MVQQAWLERRQLEKRNLSFRVGNRPLPSISIRRWKGNTRWKKVVVRELSAISRPSCRRKEGSMNLCEGRANLRRNPMSRRVGSAGESSPSFRSLYRLIKLMDAYYRGCPANGCSSSTSIDPPSPVSASFEIPTLAEGRELIRIRHFDSLVRLGG